MPTPCSSFQQPFIINWQAPVIAPDPPAIEPALSVPSSTSLPALFSALPPIPLPAQPPAPLPAPPPALPLPAARHPFSPNWPVHDLGRMNIQCPNCNVLHWMVERRTDSCINQPMFGKCCFSGKISLPTLDPLPQELNYYFTDQGAIAKY